MKAHRRAVIIIIAHLAASLHRRGILQNPLIITIGRCVEYDFIVWANHRIFYLKWLHPEDYFALFIQLGREILRWTFLHALILVMLQLKIKHCSALLYLLATNHSKCAAFQL